MAQRLNKDLFEEKCNSFNTEQIIYQELIEEVKLLNISLKEWITIGFFAVYWGKILKRRIMTQIDGLDIAIIDWLIIQKLDPAIKSPNFTAQVLLDIYAVNPKFTVPPFALSDSERDSKRRKAIRYASNQYDTFVSSVTNSTITTNIFQQKKSSKRNKETTQEDSQPLAKRNTIRNESNEQDGEQKGNKEDVASEVLNIIDNTRMIKSTEDDINTEVNTTSVRGIDGNRDSKSEESNIIEQPEALRTLHRLVGASLMYVTFQNEDITREGLPPLSEEMVTTEEIRSLWIQSRTFRDYLENMKSSVQQTLATNAMIARNIQDKRNLVILKDILENRDARLAAEIGIR